MDYIQAINIFGYWLQILILGVVAFGLWAFLGIAWKTKEEEGFLDGCQVVMQEVTELFRPLTL